VPVSSELMPRPVERLSALLARATDRAPLTDNAGKSGAVIERVTIDGERFVVKYLDRRRDWTLRASGMLRGVTTEMWARGLLARLPTCLEQPIVAVGAGPLDETDPQGFCVTALLMRDVGAWMVDVSDEPVPHAAHAQFLDHMAALHAAFWEAGPEIDLVTPMTRYLELSLWTAIAEQWVGSDHLVPKLIAQGWPLLEEVAPRAAAVVHPLSLDPGPLVTALAATPTTLVHGNFKLDNLGVTPDGRTVLLDWEGTGRGAPTSDLAWYLAINCRRLPESKQDAITTYRTALERHGVDTSSWWDRQLALALLGALVQFGWEKAFGGLDDELSWWQDRALEGARLLP
jgi:Phosphotransferase enzyme family